MSDWGQGINNTIGWGQGAINNIISWGKSYYTSYSGETSLIGSPIPNLITNFKARVAADSGIFEAESCLNSILTNLNSI